MGFGSEYGISEVKVLLLYALQQTPWAVDAHELSQFISREESVGYFDFVTALAELCDSKLVVSEVRERGEYYSISARGQRAVAGLSAELPAQARTHITETVQAYLRQHGPASPEASAVITGGEYGLFLTVKLRVGRQETMSVTLHAAEREQAEQWAKRFLFDPERVYEALLGVLHPPENGTNRDSQTP